MKHDIVLLSHLNNGLGLYRFSYNGSDKVYVGVMAQEVQTSMPQAVVRGSDGYLRVYYERLGLRLRTWDEWVASGGRNASTPPAEFGKFLASDTEKWAKVIRAANIKPE